MKQINHTKGRHEREVVNTTNMFIKKVDAILQEKKLTLYLVYQNLQSDYR